MPQLAVPQPKKFVYLKSVLPDLLNLPSCKNVLLEFAHTSVSRSKSHESMKISGKVTSNTKKKKVIGSAARRECMKK